MVRTISFFTGGVCHILIFDLLLPALLPALSASAVGNGDDGGARFAYLGVGYATHINELSTSGVLAICRPVLRRP